MKSYVKTVFVDNKDRRSLPAEVGKALTAAGGSIPQLVFMSPDGEVNYGSFNHASLKGQDYSKIFRSVKSSIRDAKKEGELSNSGTSSTEEDDQVVTSEDSDVVMILSPRLRTWKSSKGKEIQAKLIKFENGIYYLQTSRGKEIPVTSQDLDETSVQLADELVNVNS